MGLSISTQSHETVLLYMHYILTISHLNVSRKLHFFLRPNIFKSVIFSSKAISVALSILYAHMNSQFDVTIFKLHRIQMWLQERKNFRCIPF